MNLNQKLDRIYVIAAWVFAIASPLLITWRVYWMNANGIGAKTSPIFALPLALMSLALFIPMSCVLLSLEDRRNRAIASVLTFVFAFLVSEPWEMIRSN